MPTSPSRWARLAALHALTRHVSGVPQANVMLEYTYDEAVDVLQTSLNNAKEKLVCMSCLSSDFGSRAQSRGVKCLTEKGSIAGLPGDRGRPMRTWNT